MSRARKRTDLDREVVEVFGFPRYLVQSLRTSRTREPYIVNGEVGFERYRVTVERIEEPDEVLVARLVDLWETSDNIHDMTPLKKAAKALGATLAEYTLAFGAGWTLWLGRRDDEPRRRP